LGGHGSLRRLKPFLISLSIWKLEEKELHKARDHFLSLQKLLKQSEALNPKYLGNQTGHINV
jgi:hypothetical protein